jgi:hypothetical protein
MTEVSSKFSNSRRLCQLIYCASWYGQSFFNISYWCSLTANTHVSTTSAFISGSPHFPLCEQKHLLPPLSGIHPHLVPRSWKSRTISLLPLWTRVACYRMKPKPTPKRAFYKTSAISIISLHVNVEATNDLGHNFIVLYHHLWLISIRMSESSPSLYR